MSLEDKQEDLLKNIRGNEDGCIRITNKHAMAFWNDALVELERKGLIESEQKENYEGQYSWIEVKLAPGTDPF